MIGLIQLTFFFTIVAIIAFSVYLVKIGSYNIYKKLILAFRMKRRFYLWGMLVCFIAFIYLWLNQFKFLYYIMLLLFYMVIGYNTRMYGVGKYEKEGYLSNWYDETYKYMGSDWTDKLYKLFIQSDLIDMEKEQLVFCSPSANRGIYEKELFNKVNVDRLNNIFIISDLAILPNSEADEKQDTNSYSYYKGINANSIGELLDKHGLNEAGIIYDYKGCIWHEKASGNYELLEKTLNIYHSTLKPGGVLIIDNNKVRNFSFNMFVWEFFGKVIGFCEDGTGLMIQHIFNSSGKSAIKVKELLNSKFEISYIGNDADKTSLIVFKKKIDS